MSNVSVIISAYNEGPRIAEVLKAVKQTPLVHEVIVVDDGSIDNTADVAQQYGVRVHRLSKNQGKGTAMRMGALDAVGDIILFLDADLRGLTPEHIDSLIRPVLTKHADMSIGIFKGGRVATDLAQCISPNLSGQRCISRDFFLSAPLIDGSRSGVEIALTVHARACKLNISIVPLDGATHPMKEEKIGVMHGILARARMYTDIAVTLVKYQLSTRVLKKSSVNTR
ncbi:MAG TPA: glycosyltransferase family 2 protein [Armatimonadota bacterium]|nr:glycosyltransferase family 2 protein [Armatimonadota bacterium]